MLCPVFIIIAPVNNIHRTTSDSDFLRIMNLGVLHLLDRTADRVDDRNRTIAVTIVAVADIERNGSLAILVAATTNGKTFWSYTNLKETLFAEVDGINNSNMSFRHGTIITSSSIGGEIDPISIADNMTRSCTRLTQQGYGVNLRNLLKGLGVKHKDSVLVRTNDIHLTTQYAGIIRRTAQTCTINTLIDILTSYRSLVIGIDCQATVYAIIRTAIVDDIDTISDSNLDWFVVFVAVAKAAGEEG